MAWIYFFVAIALKEVHCREHDKGDTVHLQEMVENLVAENKMIISQLHQQERELNAQAGRIASLETTIADLTTRLLQSDQKVEACQTTMSQLTAIVSEGNASQDRTVDGNESATGIVNENIEQKNVQGTGRHLLVERKTDTPVEKLNAHHKRQVFGENEVAFSAGVSTKTDSLGPGQVIVFDKVLVFVDSTNSPSTYSTSTGVFTAPVSGVYVFSTTILGTRDISGHFLVYKNNSPVSVLTIHGSISHTWDSAAQTILLLLDRGDNVTMRNGEAGHVIEGQFHNEPHSIFSGFLLYEHESQPGVIG